MAKQKVLIVGGGIGGLTLSLCLAKLGITSAVFERRSNFREVGAGIQLSPNCTRVYDFLGVLDSIRKVAQEPQEIRFQGWKGSRLLSQIELGPSMESRYGYPYLNVHRGDLVNLLAELAGADRGIELYPSCDVESFRLTDDRVQVSAGGKLHSGSVLVGADGINSLVRSKLFGEGRATFTGNAAWRALVPLSSLKRNFEIDVSRVWWGPGRHFVSYAVQSGKSLNCVAVAEHKSWEKESWNELGSLDELQKEFLGWDSGVQELIHAIAPDRLFKWGLFGREPLKRWSSGRAVLLGDACHALLPFMAQGGAMAIEDAACLALCLAEQDDSVRSIQLYEQLRKPRTRKVLAMSARNAHIFHFSGLAAAARNLALKFFDPKIDEFLYGYNVFEVKKLLE